MNIVLYHIHYGDFSYIDNAEKAIAAARKVYPSAKIWQVTDLNSPFFKGVDERIRLTEVVPPGYLNVKRCLVYRDILNNKIPEGEPVMFIDTDVILGEKLDVFEEDFDVGLTKRDGPLHSMPFNFGVIFARNTQFARGFFTQLADVATGFPQGIWYVDQISLAMLMGVKSLGGAYRRIDAHDPIIEIFPCAKYNFSPDSPPTKKLPVVHFKGGRKAWLDDYYRTFIAT